MKNKIQSYVGMRLGGRRLIDTLTTHLSPTNHPLKHGIGKYIFSFLLVLAMSVGQMWAADPTHESPSIVEKANRTFLNLAGTPSNVTVSTDFYSNYGPGYFISNKGADLSASWWSFTGTFKSSSSSYSNVSGAVGFHDVGSSSSSEFYQILQMRTGSGRMTQMDFYVTGTTQMGFQWKNGGSSGKYLTFSIYEMDVTGATATDGASPVSTVQGTTTSSSDQYAASATLDGSKYYHVVVTPLNTSNINFYGLTFKHAPAASYTITYDANGGSGDAMESSTNTVSACTFTAPTGKEFKEWNTLATGLGDSYDPGDAASSDLDLFAIWQTKVEKFTVVYKDGTTELGSEVVNVGDVPAGIADPTKDCYTFAGWDPALSGVSGSDGDEIEVNATWTPNYAFGAYSFVNVAEVGTAPNKLTMSNGNTVNVPAGSRVDNFYFSAMAIKYESGASTALNDYKGWKINTKDATIKFLVENNCQVKVAIGSKDAINVTYTEPDGTAKNAISQGQQTEVSYLAKAGTLFTIKTATANTTTLKRITISPLYNATYTDETGDASGSDENVTEVTLPTPSATTVGSYSFTGWVANQTVYDGETPKTTGEALNAGGTYTLTATTTFTAQWALIADFDVKFFQGYGDPDVQIGETQSISTGNFAAAPADPERAGFAFLGWSYDATVAHIVDVATYGITAATDFTAMWKAVWTVTFDGAGAVNVEDGEAVASPNSPSQSGKVFAGWYNGESKYDFSAAVTEDLTLESKWTTADANHYYYNYKDDFHFDGVVYKTPEGKVDEGAGASNIAITTPYTLFSGAEGITSIVATKAIYDSKSNWVNAYLKINTSEDSYLTFTIASGYTAVLKMKMGGYSQNPTVTLKKGEDVVDATSGTIGGVASTENNYNEITYNLVAGTYTMTTTVKTLYISHIDLEATALPTHSVTYKPGDGEGAWVVDADATEVADCPGTFTAPTGKVFNGWKNESDDSDVAVGAIVEDDMNLIAQWINVYAVTFNMNGHGDAIDPQDIKEGAKATRPDDPVEIGYDFGGWFTDNGTFEAPFDFNTPIIAATPLYAKWTADPCPDKKSIVKAVMATNTTATVTGYNSNEYAGGYIVNNLADDASNTNMYDFGEGEVKGFKLKGSNSAIFATLSKGGFEVGDQVVFAVTKNAGDNKLAIYAAKDKDHVLKLVELDVDAAGIYTYRLTQDNIDAIEAAGSDYLSIGTFRGDYNPYIYSVELKGCRSWAIFHTLTFKNIDGTATIAAEPLEEGAYASTVAPVAPKITLKRFLGWSESIGGSTVDLTTYTITEDKTLYAVYEDIVCPTTGTVYKFEIKDELPSENLPTSTDKDMSSYITATGDGYLTYTATANNKATINSDGTIQMKDASAAYLKVELECALAAGDQIRAHVTNNPMRVQVGTTYDSNKDLILAKNAYEFVAITSAMEGKQVLYITRSSNGNANLADFEIYRPAKFDVSFDMMGHGSAIADIEDVLEGSKIVAPTAPTDEDFAFAGWYKENTLENEWDFDIDVVNAATTLYAKWLDKSDATLKSLQYGSTEIVLEAGVYEYNVTLSSLTSSVPALTAVANSPLATPVVVDATAFDSEGNATSTVTVTPAVGSAQVYTVNFARGEAVDQVNVTAATTWDWSLAGSTTLENITDAVLANVPGITNDATFNSQALLGTFNKLPGDYFQGSKLSFTTEVAGLLTITFRGTNNHARHMQVCIGNEETVVADWDYNSSSTSQTKSLLIPVGKVTLKAFEGEAAQNVRIYNMALKTDPDYTRDVTEGRYGTICLPNGGVMTGAEIFEIAYYGETSQKIFLDNIINGEMVAGRPYIFLPKEGATQLAVFYTDEANASQGSYNGLIGFIGDAADEYFYIPAGEGNYILQNNLYREVAAGAQARILSNRAYIKLSAINLSEPALAPGRRRISMSVMSEQVTTGMENTGFESEAPRKVLINGELFIIRGEKMFDAKGQLVK